jgi:patatin-like phospholipase/acyl hydrolase
MQEPSAQAHASPFRVLSIDGGGIRGIYSAAYLAWLGDRFAAERDAGPLDIGKGFDLLTGTSTGAIVACAAAMGVPMSKVVELYRRYGPQIFTPRLPDGVTKAVPQIYSRPASLAQANAILRTALQSILAERTLGDVYRERGIAMSIPAVEMGQWRAWVFKTPHLGSHRDDGFALVDVCLASSAAPIFRSLAAVDATDSLGGHWVFADGGLWANNPVLVGLIDALLMAPNDRPIEIFCLGTCTRGEGEQISRNDVHRGLVEWKFGGKAAQLSIAAQEYAFDNMGRMLAGILTNLGRNVRVVRFPSGKAPTAILQYLDLDDARPQAMDALVSQARADVNLTKAMCDDPHSSDGALIRTLFSMLPALPPSSEASAGR